MGVVITLQRSESLGCAVTNVPSAAVCSNVGDAAEFWRTNSAGAEERCARLSRTQHWAWGRAHIGRHTPVAKMIERSQFLMRSNRSSARSAAFGARVTSFYGPRCAAFSLRGRIVSLTGRGLCTGVSIITLETSEHNAV